MNKTPFSNIIGNDKVKSKLNFYLDNYKNDNFFPPVLLSGAKGDGKTLFSREIGRNLVYNGKPKKFIEINGIALQKPKHFFEDIVIPYMQNENCSIFVDESHGMGIDTYIMFLQILSPNDEHFNTYMYDGVTYDFDLTKHSFIFASSEPHLLLDTFMDRLEHIEIPSYKVEELAKIAGKHLKEFKINDDLLIDIASVCRTNARGALKLSTHINNYLKFKNKVTL